MKWSVNASPFVVVVCFLFAQMNHYRINKKHKPRKIYIYPFLKTKQIYRFNVRVSLKQPSLDKAVLPNIAHCAFTLTYHEPLEWNSLNKTFSKLSKSINQVINSNFHIYIYTFSEYKEEKKYERENFSFFFLLFAWLPSVPFCSLLACAFQKKKKRQNQNDDEEKKNIIIIWKWENFINSMKASEKEKVL